MAVVDVRSHPHPPFWRRGIVASPLLFDSPASSQLGRVPLGFASPPHDGFALLASAHGYACLLAHFQCLLSMHHTLNPRATQYLSEKFAHRKLSQALRGRRVCATKPKGMRTSNNPGGYLRSICPLRARICRRRPIATWPVSPPAGLPPGPTVDSVGLHLFSSLVGSHARIHATLPCLVE